ncbi:NAD(P)-dependent oxidoreductase [Candidatus Gottesmanbacteria bacterium]|nr:NAD(P)-dependent oxidoreductase [Candidatus Gottesmanbacteria bacterium]
MKVLITGATGFLGVPLVTKLSKFKDIEIIACGHKRGKYAFDITKPRSIEKLISKIGSVDVLIHLAANVPKQKKEDLKDKMFTTNKVGTFNLLMSLENKVKKIIFASTAEVYGFPKNNNPITERYLPNPVSYYGASKLAAEKIIQIFSKRYSIPYTILRFSTMYGPADPIDRAIPNFIKRAINGEKPQVYGGEDLRDYLYIDDAVEALIAAMENVTSGIFNIASGKTISIKETALIISKKINPLLGVEILANKKDSFDMPIDVSKARKLLGFSPKYSFPDQLDKLIAWQRKN